MPFHEVSRLVREPLAKPVCDGKPDNTYDPVKTLDRGNAARVVCVTSSNDKMIYGILCALMKWFVIASSSTSTTDSP